MTLADTPLHVPQVILKLDGAPTMVSRLRELGFIQGESVLVSGRAPFGEPLIVEIRGSTVALRKLEARCVLIR